MNTHRNTRTSSRSRNALRFGLLAAGVATLASAVPAQAAEGFRSARDDVRTTANHFHHVRVRDSFTVHQLGAVGAADVRNQVVATGAGCGADDACRSVALSFQIVTLAGEHVHLNAVNTGRAVNDHCTGCQTLAGAYQFIVETPRPVRLDRDTLRRLDAVHRRLDDLGRSGLPAAELKKRADALATEVTGILKNAHPAEVTVHRHLQGWPGH
ncbi:hypothetical protein ACIHFE_15880 [Streptomyces sp. NPDC052396]|uniref:hypothetical protein n=1 Tax=Streptomyces sp. NPDC052396 TaxID=3365689 RepID=UPI0037CEF090